MTVYPYKADRGLFFPVVRFSLIFKNTKIVIEALVDSGASISVFSADVAEVLGIKVESGKRTSLGGVGGSIVGYEHQVELAIAQLRTFATVVFSKQYKIGFNLIGRQDVFDKFTICFNEKRKQLELKSS